MHFHPQNCAAEFCDNGDVILLQKGYWEYPDGEKKYGFRFILKYPNGRPSLRKGQTCIPSMTIIVKLVCKAVTEGWADDNFT